MLNKNENHIVLTGRSTDVMMVGEKLIWFDKQFIKTKIK